MLDNPINLKYMVPVSQEIYIAKRWSDPLINIGVYKNPDRTSGAETVEDTYANWKTKKIKNGNYLNVKCDIHELKPEILAIIENGLLEYSSEVAAVTDRIEEFKPGFWSFTKDIILKSRNADKSAVDVDEVKALISGNWQTLTLTTDYIVGITSFGDTYIKLVKKTSTGKLDTDAPSVVTISVKYSATPDPTLKKLDHAKSGIPLGFVMVLEEKWTFEGEEVGVRILLENCKNVKGFAKSISDDDGTTAGYPCDITGEIIDHEYFGF